MGNISGEAKTPSKTTINPRPEPEGILIIEMSDTKGTEFEDFDTKFYKVEVPKGKYLKLYGSPSVNARAIDKLLGQFTQ